jgi:predicted phage-related endonuclease
MRLIQKPEHGTLEWLVGRQKDENGNVLLGGSDAPALMGASQFKTRGDLYVDKLTEPVVDNSFNMAFHRGNVVEPVLVAEASRILGIPLLTPDVMYREGRWNINSDGVDNAESPTVNIECKTTTRYTVTSSDDLPIEWRWQGYAQMAVMNVPVFFSVLDARQNLSVVELPRDNMMIDLLLQESEVFCDAVESNSGITDYLDQFTADQIARLVDVTETSVELPDEAQTWLTMLDEARYNKKEAEDAEREAKDALARLLLGNEIGLFNGNKVVTWQEQAGKTSVDLAGLRTAHPDIVAQFERAGSPFRVMRIVKKKEK